MDGRTGTRLTLDRVQAIWARRKWLAIVVLVVPLAAGVSVVAALPSLYRSIATVLVERQQVPENLVKSTVTSELETRLQTISQEILSRARLEGLINRFGLYADQRDRLSPEALIEQLRRDIKLDVRAARNSATVAFALSHRGRDPNTVAQVTNTLASFYIEENLKARERQASGTTEFLKAQLNDAKKRLDDQERQVSDFKRRYLGELPQQMTGNLATLEALNGQLRLNSDNLVRIAERRDTLVAQIAEAESTLLTQLSPANLPAAGPELPAVHLSRLKQELTAARARFTDLHPSVIRLKEEIATVERDLAVTKETTARDAAAVQPAPVTPAAPNPYVRRLQEALRSTDIELKLLKAEEQRLRGGIAVYQARVENTPRREQEFQDISRDYETTKELHRSLIKAYESAQISESMEHRQKGEQFRLLDPALPSEVTASPNRQRLLLMVLALSVGLSVGAVVLAEYLDSSFHTVQELREFSSVPVLVSIPRITSEGDLRRQRMQFRFAAVGAVVVVTLVAGASYYVAHGNEGLVRMLDRDRVS